MPQRMHATIVGGGLAGSEAAWQLARRGVPVTLFEMRPGVRSPAHHSDRLAELVCSNSLKSDDPATATGLLKRELAALGSLVVATARSTALPAGAALAVDREAFASSVTDTLEAHPLIEVVRAEIVAVPEERPVLIATGPLTGESLADDLSALIGPERLAFYDAAAPIVDAATIDRSRVFAASRYDKGGGRDYLNSPLSPAEYRAFHSALLSAETVRPSEFESEALFEACLPVEQLARRGEDALRYGPMKPVGLVDPATGQTPFAVVQLRAENRDRTAYNLVGFQTSLTFQEQRRVLSLIPGLEGAEILRYGVMHRNTFVDAPRVLDADLRVRGAGDVYLAGQLTGTEGYLEAAGTGLLAALNMYCVMHGLPTVILPKSTALGALVGYATSPATSTYQPMHVNFGLVPPLDPPVSGKRRRYAAYADRATEELSEYLSGRPDLEPVQA